MSRSRPRGKRLQSFCLLLLCVALSGCVQEVGAQPGHLPASQVHLTWPRDPRWTVAIQWRTEAATGNAVIVAAPGGGWHQHYGEVPVEKSVTSGVLHRVELSGLRPGVQYRYAVMTDSGMSRSYAFVTAPSKPASFTFAAFADQGDCVDFRPACKVNRQLVAERPAFVLGAGDLSYADDKGIPAEDRWLQDISAYASSAPLMPTAGNHEFAAGNPSATQTIPLSDLYAHFALPTQAAKGYYSFTYGGVHAVALPDVYVESKHELDTAFLTWLQHDLELARATRTVRWIVVYLHRPIYSTGQRHGAYKPFVKALVPLFDRYHVDVAISGHEHEYERTLPLRAGVVSTPTRGAIPAGAGTVYVVSGGGGAGLYKDFGPAAPFDAVRASAHEHLVFTVTPSVLRMTAVTTEDHVIDDVVIDHR